MVNVRDHDKRLADSANQPSLRTDHDLHPLQTIGWIRIHLVTLRRLAVRPYVLCAQHHRFIVGRCLPSADGAYPAANRILPDRDQGSPRRLEPQPEMTLSLG